MSRLNAPKTKQTALAVAGADLDASLTALLTAGDKVLVEVNGARIISEHACPLVAEYPWTVISNEPPGTRKPTPKNTIVLHHPEDENFELVLHYSNILHLKDKQPAIFEEPKAGLSIKDGIENTCNVILQHLSHYLTQDQVGVTFPQHDPKQAAFLLDDEEWSRVVLNDWIKALKTFNATGWGVKSLKRFALRAGITWLQAKALRAGNWTEIRKFDRETLIRVHEGFHWSDHFIKMAPLFLPPSPSNVSEAQTPPPTVQRGKGGNNAPKEERPNPRGCQQ